MGDQLRFNASINLETDSARNQFQTLLRDAVAGSESAQKKINSMLGGKEKKVIDLQYDSNLGEEIPVAKTLLTEFDKIKKRASDRNRIEEGSLTKLRAQLRQATQARDAYAKITVAAKGTQTAVGKINQKWREQDRIVQDLNRKIADASGNWTKMLTSRIPGGQNIMNIANGLTQIGFAAGGVIAAFQAINQAIGPVVARTKQLQGLDLALQGFGLNAQQSEQIMKAAKRQALTYGASLTSIEKGYKRITPAVMNAGGSMQQTVETMASLSARTTTLGLNSEQTSRYIEAFAQVMGKGKLQGEELNQQFSELDGALRGQIAAYLEANHGITDFEKAMADGKITAKLFMEAFNAISESMREDLAGAVSEVQARIDDLNVQQIQNISDTLNNITLESLGETFGHFGKQMMSVKLMLEQFFANIATTMPGTQKLVQGVMAVIGGAIQATVVGALGLLKALFALIETVVNGWMMLGQAFLKVVEMIPGGSEAIQGIKNAVGGAIEGLQNFTDGWLAVGEGVVGTGEKLSEVDGRIVALQNQFAEGKISADELAQGLARIREEAGKDFMMQNYDLMIAKVNELKAAVKEATEAESDAQSAFDAEKQKLEQLKLGVSNYFKDKKAKLAEEKEAVTRRYDAEIEAIKRAQSAMKNRHEQEMNALKMRNSEIQAGIQAEIDALGGKTPAEEKLAQLRKQEIMDKLKSGELSEKEKLQLQAQLERMQRQKQIEEAQLRLKAEKENAAKAEAALAEKQKLEAQALKEAEAEANNAKKQALDEIKEKQKSITKEQEKIAQLFERGKKAVDLTGKSMTDITALVDKQVTSYESAKTALDAAKQNVENMKSALSTAKANADQLKNAMNGVATAAGNAATQIRNAAIQQANLNRQRAAGAGRASGGPVTGGTTYTVNELGTEGFLTKSGRLSQINAPAFGQWKAPSSGTVIPAHIWAGLKAQGPSGVATVAPTAVGATGGIMAAVRAMAAPAGDNVTNNLTITTDNVDRTVQQSLVSLRRTKRARYY